MSISSTHTISSDIKLFVNIWYVLCVRICAMWQCQWKPTTSVLEVKNKNSPAVVWLKKMQLYGKFLLIRYLKKWIFEYSKIKTPLCHLNWQPIEIKKNERISVRSECIYFVNEVFYCMCEWSSLAFSSFEMLAISMNVDCVAVRCG